MRVINGNSDPTARRRGRPFVTALAIGIATFSLGACDRGARDLDGGAGTRPSGDAPAAAANPVDGVVASPVYGTTVAPELQEATLGVLRERLAALRAATTTGWQVRQDDATGLGAELTGGTYTAAPGTDPLVAAVAFLTQHGTLFGITDPRTQLSLPPRLTPDSNDIATLRTTQQHDGVPVESTTMLLVVRDASGAPEISYVKARLLPDIALDPVPTVSAEQAAAIAAAGGAEPTAAPVLVIADAGSRLRLAWKLEADYVATAGSDITPNPIEPGPVTAYVDARTGDLIGLRPASLLSLRAQIEPGAAAAPGLVDNGLTAAELNLPSPGTPITITGIARGGIEVTVNVEQMPDGSIAFIDSSQPGADRTTGKGLNVVYDGSGLRSTREFPGPVATGREGVEPDTDTLTAAWAAKTVLDYYRTEHGRASWDGTAAPLVSTVNMPEALVNCNAFFSSQLGQMVYGGRCELDGEKVADSFVDISVVGHEITHGVTDTAAPFISETSGQGAALNEGNSDYFGVIIQNRAVGTAHSTQGVSMCEGQRESQICRPFEGSPNGGRNLDSGAVFDDSEFVLREPDGLLDQIADIGSAHNNSLVWTNALWQIRKAFASQDGGDMLTSQAAARFDRIVYRTITTYFTSDTDMSSAAAAVLQAAIDLEASPDELNVIQQQFVISQLCLGCTTPQLKQRPVATTVRIEHRPQIVNGGIVYITQSASQGVDASVETQAELAPTEATGAPISLSPPDERTFTVAGAGDWVVETQYVLDNQSWYQLRNLRTSSVERLDPYSSCAAPAVSNRSVIWCVRSGSSYTIKARDNIGGTVATRKLSSRPLLMAVDGKLVAYLLQDGTIESWITGTGETKALAKVPAVPAGLLLPRQPGAIAVSGLRVAALVSQTRGAIPRSVLLFDLSAGTKEVLSKTAYPAGLALDGENVVWAEVVGRQPSGVAAFLGDSVPDVDLMLYSAGTKAFGIAVRQRGQQGFPSLKGRQLAWQDSVSGGDDIYTASIGTGL